VKHSNDEFDRLSIKTQVNLMYRHLNIKENVILIFLKKNQIMFFSGYLNYFLDM